MNAFVQMEKSGRQFCCRTELFIMHITQSIFLKMTHEESTLLESTFLNIVIFHYIRRKHPHGAQLFFASLFSL